MNLRAHRLAAVEKKLAVSDEITEIIIHGGLHAGDAFDHAKILPTQREFIRAQNEAVEVFRERVREEAKREDSKFIVFDGVPLSSGWPL